MEVIWGEENSRKAGWDREAHIIQEERERKSVHREGKGIPRWH